MSTQVACGIDVGFSEAGATSGVSAFCVERGSVVRIRVLRPTEVLTSRALEDLVEHRKAPFDDARLRLVTLDAPVTRTGHRVMPASGRIPDRRFSWGLFANSNRGPQPSSILVPKQGWPLYQQGMRLLQLLAAAGFPYVGLPEAGLSVVLPTRGVMEVLPKLTLTLLSPRALLAVSRPRRGFYRQIDNWLFPHMFVPEAEKDLSGVTRGSGIKHVQTALGVAVTLDTSVYTEAARIDMIATQDERHEAIGAFVAGFQAALALAGVACAVGDEEAHFLLPRTWHPDWEAAWEASEREDEPVPRVAVVP